MGSGSKGELKLPLTGYWGAGSGMSPGQKTAIQFSLCYSYGAGCIMVFGPGYHPVTCKIPKKCEKSNMAEPKYLSPKPNIKEVSLFGSWVGIEPYTNALGGLVKGP